MFSIVAVPRCTNRERERGIVHVTAPLTCLVSRIPKRQRISESSAYEADIKTEHEPLWRRATLISRKHSAARMPTGSG